ncbi:hypothetical protein [Microbacterium testaceum]|uniref:hypothetical protein n=1 Tax=Microbacterium testaceum TaxID=2033 RepID=UPI0012459B8D|nr:hypothetical protein [Microbacterium testaceum]
MLHRTSRAETLVAAARVGREEELWGALRDLGVQVAELGPDEPLLLGRLRAADELEMPDTCVLAAAAHLRAPVATSDARLAAAAGQMSLRLAASAPD